MRFLAGSFKYLAVIGVLILTLTACERPLQSDESTAIEDFTTESAATIAVEQGLKSESEEQLAMESQNEAPDSEPDQELIATEVTSEQELVETEGGDTSESVSAGQETTTENNAVTPEADNLTSGTLEATATPVFQESIEEEPTPESSAQAEEAELVEQTEETEAGGEGTTASGQDASGSETAEEPSTQAEESLQALPETHIVQSRESLYQIGLQYGISWVALAEYNNIFYPYYIYAGQALQIPGGTSSQVPESEEQTPEAAANYIDYTVQFGDTLAKISQQFGVPAEAIIEVNGLVNPNLIYAGQVLKLPTTSPGAQEAITHVVQWGETLYLISLQYGVNWLQIAEENNIQPPYMVYAGQTLVIPGG